MTAPFQPPDGVPAAVPAYQVPGAADPPMAQTPPTFQSPGAAWAAAPPSPTHWNLRRGLTLAGIFGLIALCGLGVLWYVGSRIGPVALSIGIGVAILPVPLLVFCFLWLDRYDPEPVRHLAFCFAWGAGVATAVSLVVNTFGANTLARLELFEGLAAVLIAPLVEEISKATGPALLAWRRKTCSGVIDGIVYCGLSATGFAMVENILYLGARGYAEGVEVGGPAQGAANVVGLFVARILLSGFAHPLFTAMTGIGIGIAARARDWRMSWIAPLGGLLAAMILHACWNLMAVLFEATRQGYVMLYGYFAVMMPIFLGMIGFVLWLRSSEAQVTERTLATYVRAGWFSPPEVAALATFGRRLSARRWARRVAGKAGAKAMQAYQFEATRLALLRDGIRRGLGVDPGRIGHTLAEERRLLSAIASYRMVFTGRDGSTPPAFWDGAWYHILFPDGVARAVAPPEQPVLPVPVLLGQPGFGSPVRGPLPGSPYGPHGSYGPYVR